MKPVVITVAPNGARRGKSDHPALPVTTDEIIADVRACRAAGASMVHLHVRDAAGQHTLDAGRYLETIAALKAAVPDILIQITTEAAGICTPDMQLRCLETVAPAFASVAVREIAQDPGVAARLYRGATGRGTSIQHILYDTADLQQLSGWWEQGIVPRMQSSLLFVLGHYTTGRNGRPRDLIPFIAALPDDCPWAACAFGPDEGVCVAAAMAFGGHVRVGFENNILGHDGSPAKGNADLVKHACRSAPLLGRRVAIPSDAHRIMSTVCSSEEDL